MSRPIDADALLENLKKTDRYFMLKFDIEEAPTLELQSQDKWIPVSEKLPERNELVLVSFKTGEVQVCEYLDDGTSDSWFSLIDNCYAWNNVVNAWMPLPAPYRDC